MAKFRVTGGSHVGREGRVFNQGDIVESSKDLTKLFKNKFERVHAPAAPEVEQEELPDVAPQVSQVPPAPGRPPGAPQQPPRPKGK